jgi:maspardin
LTASTAPLETQLSQFRAAYPERQFEYSGTLWRYRSGGAGSEPILWLTGALGLGDFAFGYALALGQELRLLLPDYPPLRSLDGMADGLVAVLDVEGVRAAHVVGGSFGGLLAQHLVRRHPDRARSLVLSHTLGPQRSYSRAALSRILSWLLPERPYRALFSRRLRVAFIGAEPFWLRYFDSRVAALAKRDLVSRVLLASRFLQLRYAADDLANWPGQILILDADDDPLMPAAARKALRALYPRAHVHTFSGTGHSAAILQPEIYAQVIRKFLLSGTV